MDEKQLEEIKASLQQTIKTEVNGKIDRLQTAFDTHTAKMQPMYEAYRSANTGGRFIIWLSKVVMALSIVGASVIALIKFIK